MVPEALADLDVGSQEALVGLGAAEAEDVEDLEWKTGGEDVEVVVAVEAGGMMMMASHRGSTHLCLGLILRDPQKRLGPTKRYLVDIG